MSKIEVKKKAGTKAVTAWSYSRLTSYETCPLKFKFTALDGIKEPGSPAMDRGSAIHKEGEDYLKDVVKEVPESYAKIKEEMEYLKSRKAMSELEITFTKEWTPTGWFDDNAWLRIKIDVYLSKETYDGKTVRIDDIKTGKNRGGYEDQLELYCLAALIMDPAAKQAEANLLFVDSGEVLGTSHGAYMQKDVEKLKKKWEKRVSPMFMDTLFSPSPNQYCKYCIFRIGGLTGGCTY